MFYALQGVSLSSLFQGPEAVGDRVPRGVHGQEARGRASGILYMRIIMVLILDGNSEHGANV